MNIFTDFRAQVNGLPAFEFLLERERINVQFLLELLKARDAFEPERDMEAAGGENPAFREPDIEGIVQRRSGGSAGGLEFEKLRIRLILNVKRSILRNLTKVDFHNTEANFVRNWRVTWSGTNGETSPFRRATSLTIRELRKV